MRESWPGQCRPANPMNIRCGIPHRPLIKDQTISVIKMRAWTGFLKTIGVSLIRRSESNFTKNFNAFSMMNSLIHFYLHVNSSRLYNDDFAAWRFTLLAWGLRNGGCLYQHRGMHGSHDPVLSGVKWVITLFSVWFC